MSNQHHSYGQTKSTIWGPTLVQSPTQNQDPIEVSLHSLPKPLEREFRHVFSHLEIQEDDILFSNCEWLAIPTHQHAKYDLVKMGDEIEEEKDRLLNVFMEFGRTLCETLLKENYWADLIDPCSGLPTLNTLSGNKVYSEVDGMQALLQYKVQNAGCCKILLHPRYGSAVYPATIFCYAPRSRVLELLMQYCRKE